MREGWNGAVPKGWGGATEERFRADHPGAVAGIAAKLAAECKPLLPAHEGVVLLCIGTDRSIGDALGPLVGSLLTEESTCPSFHVLGTVEEPVHASNLAESLRFLNQAWPNALIVAVDACLGRLESVGSITVGQGALRPGAGVNKSLPPVGHVYITGVVNVGGFMEYFVLQNTRLGPVMRMARVIASGVRQGLWQLGQEPRVPRSFTPSG